MSGWARSVHSQAPALGKHVPGPDSGHFPRPLWIRRKVWTQSTPRLVGQIHHNDFPAQLKATSHDHYVPERFRHVVRAPQSHELVLDTHANPTEPERGSAKPHPRQAERPPARALILIPTHLNRLPRRPGHSPRTSPSEDATTSFVQTSKQNRL